MSKLNHRLYVFGNFYLSSIQQGVQAAHMAVRLLRKYNGIGSQSLAARRLREWADEDETMILLNGGMSADLGDQFNGYSDLTRKYSRLNDYPFECFTEEVNALGNGRRDDQRLHRKMHGVITCWGIILPELVWSAKPEYERPDGSDEFRRTGRWKNADLQVVQAAKPGHTGIFSFAADSPEARICGILEGKHLAR